MGKLKRTREKKILLEYHLCSGHGKYNTMKYLVKDKWKGKVILKEIKDVLKSCLVCLKEGTVNPKKNVEVVRVNKKNELWEIDLMGKLVGSDGSYRFIFVAIEHFTKWVEVCVVKNKDAETVANLVKKLIILKHGAPKKILTDNGLEFNNKRMKELCDEFKVLQLFNSPRHHETVGGVERANQSLMNKIKKLNG